MGGDNPEPFEIVTYAGSTLGELGEEQPPKTAKLVATVIWSWSPAHSRCDRYLICTDRKRLAWTLWAMADVDGRRMYARIASGTPYRGYAARFAAEQLLIAGWRSGIRT
jgi:hypothetical protein